MASSIMIELFADDALFEEGNGEDRRFFLAPELADSDIFYRLAPASFNFPAAAAEFVAAA